MAALDGLRKIAVDGVCAHVGEIARGKHGLEFFIIGGNNSNIDANFLSEIILLPLKEGVAGILSKTVEFDGFYFACAASGAGAARRAGVSSTAGRGFAALLLASGEDVALDDTWNYTDILWNGIQAEKVQRAFEKLNYREQTLLEKRLAICMTCGRVGSWKGRPTFEELAVMFEGSTASGAERAYRKAVDKLTELLVAEGAIHAVRLKQKSKTKRKKKIAAAIYEYQADCDGEWGEISFDFENGTAEIIRLADWDTMKTNRFANKAIAYLLNCENEKLPKETMVAFEP